MKYNLCIAEKAENDLNSASDYISFKLMNPDAAFHLRKATDEAILSIPKYPKKHPIVQDPFLAYFNVRFVVVKNYLLFFTIDESEKIVHIIRFLYAKSDWKRILQDDLSERSSSPS